MRLARLLLHACGGGSHPIRSTMSDAALSERRAAALESSTPSNAMKPSASKTWRG
jgi:hypothetical protein